MQKSMSATSWLIITEQTSIHFLAGKRCYYSRRFIVTKLGLSQLSCHCCVCVRACVCMYMYTCECMCVRVCVCMVCVLELGPHNGPRRALLCCGPHQALRVRNTFSVLQARDLSQVNCAVIRPQSFSHLSPCRLPFPPHTVPRLKPVHPSEQP